MSQPTTIRVRRAPAKAKNRRRKRVLLPNEAKAISRITKAIAIYGEGHPLIQQCMETMMRISRGERGYRGRYIGTRMRAISRIMDTLAGRPREAPSPVGAEDESRSAIVALVRGLRESEE